MGFPSTIFGHVQPFGLRKTTIGQRQVRTSDAASIVLTRVFLNRSNFVNDGVQSTGHKLMHRLGLVSLDEIWFPAVPGEELGEFVIVHTRKHRGIRDLPAIEMENRQ